MNNMTKILPGAQETFRQKFSLLVDEPLSNHTSFKVGGPADFFASPNTTIELKDLLIDAQKLGISSFIMGGGTNLLISDKGIRGLVICLEKLCQPIKTEKINENEITLNIPSGMRLSSVCAYANENGLSGLEFAAGIPGTAGGAVNMNAGTIYGSISEIVVSLNIINKESLIFQNIDAKHLNFSYRQLECFNQKESQSKIIQPIIISISLLLKKGDKKRIIENFETNLRLRNKTQPVSMASAGCFFKNPASGKPAGEMIDICGLKGSKIGGAMVSTVHANYIVNNGHATCEDILRLKEKIVETVFKEFNVKLKTEVKVHGE